jgi:hypothetical protein
MTSLTIEKGIPIPEPRRPRRPWTAEDDAHLRRFHAEGKTDGDIGYIMDRHRQLIRLRRIALSLPHNKRRNQAGWTFTDEAKARMVEENRRRLADPEYLARARGRMAKANQIRLAKMFRQPAIGTEAHNVYRKIRTVLGPRAAREQLSAVD